MTRSRRILLVEDDPCVREVLSRTICSEGAEVVATDSHDGAVRALSTSDRPDLILLDWDVNGRSPGHLLQGLPVAYSSDDIVGMSAQDRRREFAVLGIRRFLPKPWARGELRELLGLHPRERRRPA